MNTDQLIAAVKAATQALLVATLIVCSVTLAITFDKHVVAAMRLLLDQ